MFGHLSEMKIDVTDMTEVVTTFRKAVKEFGLMVERFDSAVAAFIEYGGNMSTVTPQIEASPTVANPQVRSKYTPSDIQLAMARADEYLTSLPYFAELKGMSPELQSKASVRLNRAELTTLLADYDLKMLDDMFCEAGGRDGE